MKILKDKKFNMPDAKAAEKSKDLTMLWVPPGTFLMGSPLDEAGHAYEDGRPFLATITQGFWLGQYPITQSQWVVMMNHNPSTFQGGDHPVENVSWYDALKYCEKLNIANKDVLPAGYKFSLPTQMQWEFACRAGTQNLFSLGDGLNDLLSQAWCRENSNGTTHPVGEKVPNKWGFYDMLGNVLEWCLDTAEDYPIDPSSDWVGKRDSSIKIVRGGAWSLGCSPLNIRCSISYSERVDSKDTSIGFRLCLSGT